MTEEKNEENNNNLLGKFSYFMDQNIRGVQYTIYSIAGLGLFIALRSVRPFAKFSVPSDIPKHFIQKKMSFVGKVNMIKPAQMTGVNPILLVDHQPLISLSKKTINDGLPLEISSINVTSNGFLWLQTVLTTEDVTFVPLRLGGDRVYSIVHKQDQNIGQHLVKIGFATVSPIDFKLEKDQYYLKYYKGLLSAEKKAESKGAGVWGDTKISFFRMLLNKFKSIIPFSL